MKSRHATLMSALGTRCPGCLGLALALVGTCQRADGSYVEKVVWSAELRGLRSSCCSFRRLFGYLTNDLRKDAGGPAPSPK